MNTLKTLLTAKQLAPQIHYTARHINEYLKDRVFVEGVHYVRLPQSRRILYIWEAIEDELLGTSKGIPMANGGLCHG